MSDPEADGEAGPVYQRGVWVYRQAGWRGVLPLPPAAKFPPPAGFTGYDGVWPTDQQVADWVAKKPRCNICLRVDYVIIGIDVDAYGEKTGGLTLQQAESRWGALPATYRSTSRLDDPVSGVRLFKVPAEVLFKTVITFDELGTGHIEIIQHHHRLIVCWPSVHPKTGWVYRWFAPDGTLLPEEVVPRVDDIPVLPESWVEALSRDAVREEVFDGSAPNRTRAARERINEELYRKLIALDDGRLPEPMVAQWGDKALNELMNGPGSRYETTRDHVAALMRFHAMGRAGVPAVLSDLYRAYVMEVTDTRPQHVAVSEFLRLIEGAAVLVAATMPSDDRHTTAPDSDGDGEDRAGNESPDDAPTWGPADLAGLLAGEREPLQPTMFERTDGKCLLYPGMTHSFHGESESGKSLIIQAECVHLINEGEDVLYVDFDSDSASVVARLLEFGADPQAVADHFDYRQPEVRPDSAEERGAWEEMLSTTYTLAVIDGVTDALGLFG